MGLLLVMFSSITATPIDTTPQVNINAAVIDSPLQLIQPSHESTNDAILNVFSNDSSQFKEIKVASLKCGLRPIPPLGCQVGACVCDRSGYNCQWTFICR